MTSAIDNYLASVSSSLSPAHCTALRQALLSLAEGRTPWTKINDTRFSEHEVDAWKTVVGTWHFALADFSIEDQPGRRPGDRGQNIVISNHTPPIILGSDSPAAHTLAAFLLTGVKDSNSPKAFLGTAKLRPSRVKHFEQKEHYTIDSLERLEQAAAWLEAHITMLGTSVWQLEVTPTFYRFNAQQRIAEWWGREHEATNYVLRFMGWKTVQVHSLSSN